MALAGELLALIAGMCTHPERTLAIENRRSMVDREHRLEALCYIDFSDC